MRAPQANFKKSKNLREIQLSFTNSGGTLNKRKKRLPVVEKNSGYRQQYGVIVICKDEAHQKRVYAALVKAGHTLRIVVT